MKLDGLTEDDVLQFNLPTWRPVVYRFNKDVRVANKEDGFWGRNVRVGL